MPDAPAVLVVGGSVRTVRCAAGTGARVVVLLQPGAYDDAVADLATEVRLVDYTDPAAAVAAAAELHARHAFARAVSLTEHGLLPAALINERLGLGGNPVATVRLLTDKPAMRERLNAAGLSPVPAAVVAGPAELAGFVRRLGTPAIVKPVDGSGSLAVARVDRPGDAGPVWSRLRGVTDRPLLAEAYLDGPEISVESFSFGPGRHRVLALTAKVVGANFVETGHTVPAALADAAEAEVRALVVRFLDLAGLTEGPAHTEVKLTAAGPRIVESHNRVGGDKISDLVRLATGVDQISLSFAWPLGLAAPLDAEPGCRAGAAIRFLTPAAGVVREVRGLAEVRAAASVVAAEVTVQPGATVPELWHSTGRAGYVICRAAGGAEAAALADRHAAAITVRTEAAEVLHA